MDSRDPDTFYDFFAISDNQHEDSTTMVSLTQGLSSTNISNQNLEHLPPAEQWSSWASGGNSFLDFSGNNNDDTPFKLIGSEAYEEDKTAYMQGARKNVKNEGRKAYQKDKKKYKDETWGELKNMFSKRKGKKQEIEEQVQPTSWDNAPHQNKALLQTCDDHIQQVYSPWDQQGNPQYHGVSEDPSAFSAWIYYRENFQLGSYATGEQAAVVHDKAYFELHGPDYAHRLNFPQHVNFDDPNPPYYQAPGQQTPTTYGGPIPDPGTSYNNESD